MSTANSDELGRITEAHRMAAHVVLPTDVDPTLLTLEGLGTTTLKNANALRAILAGPQAQVAQAHGFLLGFSSSRSAAPSDQRTAKTLVNAVLRFATDDDARRAAADLSSGARTVFHEHGARNVELPEHPRSLACSYSTADGAVNVAAFTAHGPYVLYQSAASNGDADVAIRLVGDSIALQQTLIDQFVPTPPNQLAALPIDPTGLLARTVPINSTEASVNDLAVYPPQAALHFQSNPIKARRMFTDGGVTAVAYNAAVVYQAIDATGAQRVTDQLADEAAAAGQHRVPDISGVDQSRCFRTGQPPLRTTARYACFLSADRYAIRAAAGHDFAARQIGAAQYLMLTAT